MEENISGRLHFEWKDIEYEQAVHACLMSSLDVKIERVMVFTPQTNSCIQVYEVIIKLAWKHFNVIYTSIFLCMCLYVLLQMWNLRKNGHIAKEKYWNSTSRQTILGKLHPVGVAVWVALKSMYKFSCLRSENGCAVLVLTPHYGHITQLWIQPCCTVHYKSDYFWAHINESTFLP